MTGPPENPGLLIPSKIHIFESASCPETVQCLMNGSQKLPSFILARQPPSNAYPKNSQGPPNIKPSEVGGGLALVTVLRMSLAGANATTSTSSGGCNTMNCTVNHSNPVPPGFKIFNSIVFSAILP